MSKTPVFVSLEEYARIWKRPKCTIKMYCQKGRMKTAKKEGRCWVIDKEEQPPRDARLSSIDRKKSKKEKRKKVERSGDQVLTKKMYFVSIANHNAIKTMASEKNIYEYEILNQILDEYFSQT